MNKKPEQTNDVVAIEPNKETLFRVRVTADPANPRTVEIVESLLTACDLSRCECTGRDGSSTWTIVVPERLLDTALDGISVTVPIESELFQSGECHMYWVTGDDWHRLGGIAEDEARCWGGDDSEDFESAIAEEVSAMIDAEIDRLPWPSPDTRTTFSERVRAEAMEELEVFTCSEEDILVAVKTAFDRSMDDLLTADYADIAECIEEAIRLLSDQYL